jgi:hypothetical protein
MKIQILSLPRTGSAYLRKMLSLQMQELDSFYTISEPFNETKTEYIDKNFIIEKIISSKNVLVKSHIHELCAINNTDLFKKYSLINWYTICLLRKNIFNMTLSRAIALHTNVWDEQDYSNLNFEIDLNFYENCLNESLTWIKSIKYNVLNFNYKKILFYEDLNFCSTNDLKLLDISLKHKQHYTSKKLYSKKQLITNYKEIFLFTESFVKKDKELVFDGVNLIWY